MLRLLSYISLAFSIWMLIDAIRRRAELYWIVIILLFGPIGCAIYFFAVKIHDYDLARLKLALSGRAGKRQLEYRAHETPSLANKLALAEALQEEGQYQQALVAFQDVMALDEKSKPALHGLGRAALGVGEPAKAVAHFEKLMELDSSYRDYSAALDYAEALHQNGQNDEAVDLLEGLVGVSSRINHRLALAHYLSLAGRYPRARDELETALRDHEHAPSFIRRRDQKWADRARKMLSEIS